MRIAKTRAVGFALSMVLAVLVVAGPARAGQAGKSPVKVFVLAGQSNMLGAGTVEGDKKGSLRHLVTDPATARQYSHLVNKDGTWVQRDDVWIWTPPFKDTHRKGKLAPGYGASTRTIGPELGFGHVVGDFLDEQVLLIKISWGGKALATDFRPPSAGGKVGGCYTEVIRHVKAVVQDLKKQFADYDGKGCEIAGFGWHQGWNDGCGWPATKEYEKNLACFIRDVRKELGVKDLPFVIGVSGFAGWKQRVDRRLGIINAQLAVAKHKEFQGNVLAMETRGFFRPFPSRHNFHWNNNGETLYLVGQAMGKGMVELLGGPKAPANPIGPTATPVPPAAAPADEAKDDVSFHDGFEGKLGPGWRWLREDKEAWRIKDGGLEIRVQPGVAHNVKNALVRTSPDRSKGGFMVDVTVTNHTLPTIQYEQAGITPYHNGKPGRKLVKELINGKLYIIPGKKPMAAKTVQLRLIMTATEWTAQYRPDAKGEFLPAGKGKLPKPGKDELSIQCYNGPPKAEHWIRFDDFRITPIKE